jgi:E3 SUMO-protein ligase PIAS1
LALDHHDREVDQSESSRYASTILGNVSTSGRDRLVDRPNSAGPLSYTNTTPHVPAALPHNPSYPTVKAPSFTSSSAGPSTSSVGRYDPYAPPLKATASTSAPTTRTGQDFEIWYMPNLTPNVAVRFKDSPFFTVLQTVGTVQECPGMIS